MSQVQLIKKGLNLMVVNALTCLKYYPNNDVSKRLKEQTKKASELLVLFENYSKYIELTADNMRFILIALNTLAINNHSLHQEIEDLWPI